ncbi:MAG TPA: hypothetical protein VER55_16255, partial [Ardenticatenaceae bacterium]|nr:hypothetical protein [Ardenticatenaceae bacterium]
MTPSQDSLVAAQAALATADWAAAKGHFESALREQESPEAHDGLGIALWWLNDVAAAHQQRMLAYVGYRNCGELPRAALIATWLAREQVFLHANGSAMNGWFARAARLLGQAGPCAEQGWFTILRASMLAAPEELRQAALQAMDVARAFGDPELEAMALAFQGLASVTLGEVENGMLCLDEAMAAATGGELRDFMVASEVFCVMLSACELAGDLVRTENWCRIASDFAQRHACPFLSAYCRTTYGSLLLATGRWQDAETELLAAIRSFESGHRGLRVHAVLKLADLRVSQGRLEEAQVLLAGYEDHGAAVVPLARLHLARGEVQLAYALLRQALGSAPSGTPGRAPLLMALVVVLLAQGDLNAAADMAEELVLCAQQAGGDLLLAQAELAKGVV